MTLTQLEYIIAVATYKNFTIAAEKCFVTQPTLSMQIAKFEEEMKINIFDRSTHPITITKMGRKVVSQCKVVITETKKIKQIIDQEKGSISGEIIIGIIPTVFSSLVPLFYKLFTKKFPKIILKIKELKTDEILDSLKKGFLDFGIAATPLKEESIVEYPLYYEPIVAYIPNNFELFNKKVINTNDLNPDRILLLEEGNCFRNNVINLCERLPANNKNFFMDSGSFLTLVKLSDEGFGMTLLPLLVAEYLNLINTPNIKSFSDTPTREISLIYHNSQIRKNFSIEFAEFIKSIIRGKVYLESHNISNPKLSIA